MSAAPRTEEPTAENTQRENGRNTRRRSTRREDGTDPWTNALGDFIRAQRQLAKLSLREMAAMTSVSNAYLSQVERGLHQPSLKVLHAIAEALQLSTEQVLRQAGWATGDTAVTPENAPENTVDDGSGNGSDSSDSTSESSTEDAIRRDPRLTPEQRTALLGVYRSFVNEGQA